MITSDKMVRQLESVLLTKWLKKFHREKTQWKRVRLGVAADPEEARMFSVTLRWADAIFLDEGFVNIVETKLKADPKAIGQLEMYKRLFPVTPEFSQFKDWPIRLILVAPNLDLAVAEMASDKGIIYDVFKPEGF